MIEAAELCNTVIVIVTNESAPWLVVSIVEWVMVEVIESRSESWKRTPFQRIGSHPSQRVR